MHSTGRSGGAETYHVELIRALYRIDEGNSCAILIWPESCASLKPLCSPQIDYRVVKNDAYARIRRFILWLLCPTHPTACWSAWW